MTLNKYRIADVAIPYSQKCEIPNLTPNQVSGINRDKEFFEPSHQVGGDTSKYQIVPPGFFACNLMHVGRDVVLPIAYNHSGRDKYVSPAYTIFHLKKNCGIIDEYFFLMLKSDERDRYFWFHADASVRDGMTWRDFCDIEISVPDITIQRKYVAIYKAKQANQQSYERGLEDLKLACEGYIKELRQTAPIKPIREYLIEANIRNDMGLPLDSVRGLATSKEMIPTKADMNGVSLKNYKVVSPRQIAYVPDTSRRGDKVSLGFNDSDKSVLVSTISVVFGTDHNYLLPEYLMLFLTRAEFDRYARFNSWGSARETFTFDDLGEMKIPIPSVGIQQAIAQVFTVYKKRNSICERMKSQLSAICPILIRGSLSDGG